MVGSKEPSVHPLSTKRGNLLGENTIKSMRKKTFIVPRRIDEGFLTEVII